MKEIVNNFNYSTKQNLFFQFHKNTYAKITFWIRNLSNFFEMNHKPNNSTMVDDNSITISFFPKHESEKMWIEKKKKNWCTYFANQKQGNPITWL